jgi:LemA family
VVPSWSLSSLGINATESCPGPEAFRAASWGAMRGMLDCTALAETRQSIDSRRRIVVWWILVLAMTAVLGYAVWTYNRLAGLSKRADAAWSDIDVQLKRRWDLVPALVETVKGYARQESSTLERVVEARGQAVQPATIAERGAREQGLAAAVSRLFAVAEAYPELKASQNFQDLQRNLVRRRLFGRWFLRRRIRRRGGRVVVRDQRYSARRAIRRWGPCSGADRLRSRAA